MAETIQGTYIEKISSGNEKIDLLVNELLFPWIHEFEQIMINYEIGTVVSPNLVRFTYQNWCKAFPVEVYLNGSRTPLSPDNYSVDYNMGKISFTIDLEMGDEVMATYCFNYFPFPVLSGFIQSAIVTLNTAGQGQTTSYTVESIPKEYLGVVAQLVVARCMEKLILEYDLWKGRLIFAISNNGIYDGSDSIVSQLETVKRNVEDQAYLTLNNPQFRAPIGLAKPTSHYWEALLAGSSARYKNGNPSYGPLRGAKFNKLMGNLPRG